MGVLKQLLCLLLCAVVLAGYLPNPAFAGEISGQELCEQQTVPESGEMCVAQEGISTGHNVEKGICTLCGVYGICGENLTWIFDEAAGTLTVSGSGDMDAYSSDDENTPWSSFADDILSIVLDEGIESIGEYAFAGCGSLTDVYYGGTESQWKQLGGQIPNAAYIHYSCTDAENHWKVTQKDATCESEGYTGEICDCGYKRINATIPVANHSWKNATCYAPKTCSECGTTEGTALQHDLSEWVVTEDAACAESGKKERSCLRDGCSYYETKIINAPGHAYEDSVKAPDCTKDGYTAHYCTNCGDYYVDSYVKSLGHDLGAWVEDGDGRERRDCSRCDYYMSRMAAVDAPAVKVSNVASSGKPRLTWDKTEGAVQYEVYRATSENGEYSLLKATSGTSLTNTSTEAGKTYYYKVRSVGADGRKSDFSNIVSRTCDLPRPVVTVSNVASSGKPKLSWDAVEGAVKYEVYRATSRDGTYSLLKTTTGTSLTNTSTTVGTTYYYKVRALHSSSSANSAYSGMVSRTCDLPRPLVTVSNVASTGKPKLTWEAIEGAVKYEVYCAASRDGTYSLLKTTTGTSLTNTSTTAGTTYYYKVKALHSSSSANSAYSGIVSRTCDLPRPALTLTLNSSGNPRLSWTRIDGAAKYQVYRATSRDGSYTLLKTTTGTSLTNTSVTAGTTYYYKVRAVHSVSSANSAYSAIKYIRAK